MVVTVYETQTPDGWDGLSSLTTLERATITQVVQQTATATEGDSIATALTISSGALTLETATPSSVVTPASTSVEPSSFSTSSSSPPPSQTASEEDPPKAAQISTGSIVGIAVGSIAASVLLVVLLLFAFGFRIRRPRRRSDNEIMEHKQNQRAAAGDRGSQSAKAELEDAGYTRRLETLHDGAKPELEGSGPRKSGWRAFSIKSLKRGPRTGVAELDAETAAKGPHELPA